LRVLILGYSDIVRRRVLPALVQCGIDAIDIASLSAHGAVKWPEGTRGTSYADYAAALVHSDAELVWISTVNSRHADLAEQALLAGRHVVIDKPAATTRADVELLVALARRQARVLAEAHVFAFHPQIDAARGVFAAAGSAPMQIVAAFSYPPLPPENFRHRSEFGGGALLDLGPYAVALGRLFFGDTAPLGIAAQGLSGDRGFSLIASYPGDRSVVGHFGMTTGYVNRLTMLGQDVTLDMQRAFTTPPEMANCLQVSRGGHAEQVAVPRADSFARFIDAVLSAIRDSAIDALTPAMLADAAALDMLRAALRGNEHCDSQLASSSLR
jgi:predicted dehydrogenase